MICKICKINKPEEEFYRGNNSKCRTCISLYTKEWRLNNLDRKHEINRRYREKHKEKLNKYYQMWYENRGRDYRKALNK